jgi:hypothetical protein
MIQTGSRPVPHGDHPVRFVGQSGLLKAMFLGTDFQPPFVQFALVFST